MADLHALLWRLFRPERRAAPRTIEALQALRHKRRLERKLARLAAQQALHHGASGAAERLAR